MKYQPDQVSALLNGCLCVLVVYMNSFHLTSLDVTFKWQFRNTVPESAGPVSRKIFVLDTERRTGGKRFQVELWHI